MTTRNTRWGLVAAAALLLPATGALAQEAARTRVPLPELPSPEVLHPRVFDADGCLVAHAPGERRKCGARTPPGLARKVPTALRGFDGPGWAQDVGGTGVVLAPEALTVRPGADGGWGALGLVRNDTADAVGAATVEAELLDAGGAVLGTARAQTPVPLLRPGEPAPFALTSEVPTAAVAEVRWTVRAAAAPAGATRDYQVKVGYELPQGADTYRGQPRDDAPYPYVLSVGFRGLGAGAARVTGTVAWLEAGRVVHLLTVGAPDDADTTVEEAESQLDDVTVGGPQGARLHTLPRIVWVSGEAE